MRTADTRKADAQEAVVRRTVAPLSNYCINATVRLVTPRACARVAPMRPARYALR